MPVRFDPTGVVAGEDGVVLESTSVTLVVEEDGDDVDVVALLLVVDPQLDVDPSPVSSVAVDVGDPVEEGSSTGATPGCSRGTSSADARTGVSEVVADVELVAPHVDVDAFLIEVTGVGVEDVDDAVSVDASIEKLFGLTLLSDAEVVDVAD